MRSWPTTYRGMQRCFWSNKSMKIVHSSPTPWRSIAKGLDLFYLKPTKKLPPELIEISSRVTEV